MTDIVERLRQVQGDNEDARKAADEIERLHKIADAWRKENYYWEGRWRDTQAEIERLRNIILGACNIFCNLDAPHWAAEFRRALEPKP